MRMSMGPSVAAPVLTDSAPRPDHLHRHMRSHTNGAHPFTSIMSISAHTRRRTPLRVRRLQKIVHAPASSPRRLAALLTLTSQHRDVLARHSKIHLDKEAEAVLEKPATNGNSASHSPSVEAYDSSGSYNPSQTAASTSKRTLEDYETASTPDRKAQSDVAPELYTADRTFAHIPFNGSFELDPIYGQVSEDRTSTMLASSQPFVGLSNAFWSDLGLGWNEETALAPPSAAAESEGRRDEALDRIAQLWPSALTANSSAPETSEPLGVPWAGMYARICAGIESQPITPPSTAFLTSAMRLYFANWSPDHPFMHEPTFKPQDHSPILSLAICAVRLALSTFRKRDS